MAAIWIAVIITSIFAPDFVSGSQQEHLKIAASINWLWGALATMSLARWARRERGAPRSAWRVVGWGTTVIWLVVVVATLAGPVFETGSDPTQIPLIAIIAPIAGLLATRFLAEFVLDAPPDEPTGRMSG
jgi:hypothetical protein